MNSEPKGDVNILAQTDMAINSRECIVLVYSCIVFGSMRCLTCLRENVYPFRVIFFIVNILYFRVFMLFMSF